MDVISSPQPAAVGEAVNSFTSYASKLSGQPAADAKSQLQLCPITIDQGVPIVEFTVDEINSFTKEEGLHQAVIFKLSYGKPDLQELRQILPKQLAVKGRCIIGQLEYRHILVRFDLFEDFAQVVSRTNGYLRVKGKEFFYRTFPWTMGFNPRKETSKAVVWISLPELPANLFAQKSILSIASSVGKPIAVDKATKDRSRPSTARVKVLINLLDKHPSTIKIKIVDSKSGKVSTFDQKIVIDNAPAYCTHCCHQGHNVKSCRRIQENETMDSLNSGSRNNVDKLQGDARDLLNEKRASQKRVELHNPFGNKDKGALSVKSVWKQKVHLANEPAQLNATVNKATENKKQMADQLSNATDDSSQQCRSENAVPHAGANAKDVKNVENQFVAACDTVPLTSSAAVTVTAEVVTEGHGSLAESGRDARELLNEICARRRAEMSSHSENVTDTTASTSMPSTNVHSIVNAEIPQLCKNKFSDLVARTSKGMDPNKNDVVGQNPQSADTVQQGSQPCDQLSVSTDFEKEIGNVRKDNLVLNVSLNPSNIEESVFLKDPANIITVTSKSIGNSATTSVKMANETDQIDERRLVTISTPSGQLVPTAETDESAHSSKKTDSGTPNLSLPSDRMEATLDENSHNGTEVNAALANAHLKEINLSNDKFTVLLKSVENTPITSGKMATATDLIDKGILESVTVSEDHAQSSKKGDSVASKLSPLSDQLGTCLAGNTPYVAVQMTKFSNDAASVIHKQSVKHGQQNDAEGMQQNSQLKASTPDSQTVQADQDLSAQKCPMAEITVTVIANPNGAEDEVADTSNENGETGQNLYSSPVSTSILLPADSNIDTVPLDKGNATSIGRDESQLDNHEAVDRNTAINASAIAVIEAALHQQKEDEERYRLKGKAAALNTSSSRKKKNNFQQRAVQQERGKADGRGMKVRSYPPVYNIYSGEQIVPFGTVKQSNYAGINTASLPNQVLAKDKCPPTINSVKEYDEPTISSNKKDEEIWETSIRNLNYNISGIGLRNNANTEPRQSERNLDREDINIRRLPMRKAKQKQVDQKSKNKL